MFVFDKEKNSFSKVKETTFKDHNIKERQDLEKWVIHNPNLLREDLLVIHSEFSNFDKTNERPDILAIDRDGKLVVVELKLDDSGKSVDFQALKYASYYSTMTFDDLVSLMSEEKKEKTPEQCRTDIGNFITNVDFEKLDDMPRIVIAAKEFRSEVTSTILWLQKFGVDISCVKLTPYQLDDNKLGITSQKIIPLPEAEEYLVKVQRKEDPSKTLTRTQKEYISFYSELIETIRNQIPVNFPIPIPKAYYQIPVDLSSTHFEWGFHGRGRTSFSVDLHFESSVGAINLERLNLIRAKADEYQKEFPEELKFNDNWGSSTWSKVYIEFPSGRITEELKQWAVDRMIKFHEVFGPILRSMN